uniref:Uncharacterized protein LOC104230343 n=1 Tax=Nicotiana sylvestris TaxID=4096 RepID=A0A1U7WVT1_NICSY|nr:PREDICTED: uncharacterized protein LOC104230343 [Nicotiana sylvestris]
MKNKQEPPKLPSPKRTVNVISGGEEINGVTYTTANKVYKVTITHGKRVRHVLEEESIIFDDADADGVLTLHNDVLSHSDMTRIPPKVMTRKLNEDPPYPPIKQKKRKQGTFKISHGIQLEAEKEIQVLNGSNPGTWILFTDGSSNVKGAGLGIVLAPPAGLELARELGVNLIVFKSDSQPVVNQMLGTYTAREARIQQYLEKVRDLIRQFQTWKVMQIPRDENVEADALANLASVVDVTGNENTSYGTILEDKKKAHVLRKKVARYCIK